MALIRNFAMSPEEIASAPSLPDGLGWMSCHFREAGLGDLPESLPGNALLILDDRIPPVSPDPEQIGKQLREAVERLQLSALLLDFQRPGYPVLGELATFLQKALPCPVAVSAQYGKETGGPVFLPLLPAHKALTDWLSPWKGRELWLEVGPAPEQALVTASGTVFSPVTGPLPPCPHSHEGLLCHYGISPEEREIRFTLVRTPSDLQALTARAEHLGVTRTVGLWQELF